MRGIGSRWIRGWRFAFGELLTDIGPWLVLGMIIAGLIMVVVPEGFIEQHLGRGFLPMLIMLAAGVPVYVCATASTPIVAALALKGLSPGAALVFLLAGPVTNVATVAVLVKLLGKQVAAAYLAAIAIVSLAMGTAVNLIYDLAGVDIAGWVTRSVAETHGPIFTVSAVVLALLLAVGLLPIRRGVCACGCH